MKNLLLSFVLLFASLGVSATHLVGGEITWKCISNGEYVFYLNIFRDCTGVPHNFNNLSINISGSPLPLNGVTSILMKPNLALFAASNNGDLSAYCSSAYGSQPSCQAGDAGVLQFLPYVSDSVRLTGTPPSSGWKFTYELPCCLMNGFQNINSSGGGMLRSIMYPYLNTRVDTCFYSSPQFVEIPNGRFCRGELVSYSNKAINLDDDSLSYANVPYLSGSSRNPINLSYKAGFSSTNPTHDASFNPNNIPYSINPFSGDIEFSIHNGSGFALYATNTRVESFRNGIILSSVERMLPIMISDCDTMPSGNKNTPPIMTAPFTNAGVPSFSTTVVAGTNLFIPIDISDTDSTGVGNNLQEITVSPNSTSLSLDFVTSTNCLNPLDTSCAVFSFAPALDINQNPARLAYKGQGAAILFLSWQTDCNHLSPSGNAKTHYFTFKVSDDHCPIPSIIYKTVEITVIPSTSNCNLITGIQESSALTLKDRVQLFPNPTTGDFSIQFANQLEEEVEIMVRDIRGKLIEQKQYTAQSRMDLSIDGSLGIYFVQITNAFGEQLNLKVIKQ